MDALFSKLRSLLANSTQDEQWNNSFCRLLQTAFEKNANEYRDIWIPYCEKHVALEKPIKSLRTISELEYWAELCPFAIYSLDLSIQNVSDKLCQELVESKNALTLHSLYLGDNRIGNLGFEAIVKSENLTRLQVLDLEHNLIGDDGCMAFAKSKNLSNLVSLYLCNNKISNVGCFAIASSTSLESLKTIDLEGNNIGDEGCIALVNSKNLSELESIGIEYNSISDDGYKAIILSEKLSKQARCYYLQKVSKECLVDIAREYNLEADLSMIPFYMREMVTNVINRQK